MVIVAVTKGLDKEMKRRLSEQQYEEVKERFMCLKKEPYKGTLLHVLGNVLLKELRYTSFRFTSSPPTT